VPTLSQSNLLPPLLIVVIKIVIIIIIVVVDIQSEIIPFQSLVLFCAMGVFHTRHSQRKVRIL